MPYRIILAVALALVAFALAGPPDALAQDSPPPADAPLPLPDDSRENLQRLTSLFIVTVMLLALAVVVSIVFAVMLRRRVNALERRQDTAATSLEDLWWSVNPDDGKPRHNDRDA